MLHVWPAIRKGIIKRMDTKTKLNESMKEAMKSGDDLRKRTIRMVLAAITMEEVAGKTARELSDAEVQKVVTKEAKKRKEAATAYTQAGRPELAAREEAELAVLERYLPQQLTAAEVEALVAETVAETGATGMPQLGLVMKALQPRVAGRADGAAVAAAVRAALGSLSSGVS